jgi:predicted CoA-binding protein
MRVAVLGASDQPEKYSNKAIHMLKAHGHTVLPVNPNTESIEGLRCFPDIKSVQGAIDTVTVYLSSKRSEPLITDIIAAKPKRIILNPGAESAELSRAAAMAKIDCLEACTLVMLSTGQF